MSDYVEAAGAIVHRTTPAGKMEVCVVHRPKYGDWSFPKGKLENRESLAHAAVREVQEETGIPVRLGMPLAEVTYPLHADGSEGNRNKTRKGGRSAKKNQKIKHVTYWIATILTAAESAMRQDAFGARIVQDRETDAVRWLGIEEASEKLTYDSDKDVLRQFANLAAEGATETSTFIIVRHGKAESRKHWAGSEERRPLTPAGAASSYALKRELACFGVTKLISSPWTRCTQTLIPYAVSCQRDIADAADITEDTVESQPATAVRFFEDALTLAAHSAASPTAVCTHRPVFEVVFPYLKSLCATTEIADHIPAESPYLQTGAALVLTVGAGTDATTSKNDRKPQILAVQHIAPIMY